MKDRTQKKAADFIALLRHTRECPDCRTDFETKVGRPADVFLAEDKIQKFAKKHNRDKEKRTLGPQPGFLESYL